MQLIQAIGYVLYKFNLYVFNTILMLYIQHVHDKIVHNRKGYVNYRISYVCFILLTLYVYTYVGITESVISPLRTCYVCKYVMC